MGSCIAKIPDDTSTNKSVASQETVRSQTLDTPKSIASFDSTVTSASMPSVFTINTMPSSSAIISSPTLTPLPDTDQNENEKDSILSSYGYLTDIPSWFPSENAHRDISKLFTKYDKIGDGVTGSVFTARYKNNIYALKQIPKNDEFGRMLFTTESRSLSKIKHPNIIKYIDMLMDENYYYLILEKADFDLYAIMRQKGFISERKTKQIIYSLLNGINHIHNKGLVHRDLKPENIVFKISNPMCPMIIDFGDAEICKKDKIYTEFVGTPPYMSPERLGEHTADDLKASDVWALAVISYEMYSGKRCFEGDTQKQVFGAILRGEWTWREGRIPSVEMQSFIKQCLELDSNQRLSAKDALTHKWFADITNHVHNQLHKPPKINVDENHQQNLTVNVAEQIVNGKKGCPQTYMEKVVSSSEKHAEGAMSPTDEFDTVGQEAFDSLEPNIQSSIGRLSSL